ncbi:MAG: glucose 1-dehydrogenase [Bacteroidota bacterium]|nr:glucose 1-dehydrogenase [Bacteroidota bacterium]
MEKNNPFDLTGKIAVITGGGTGLGLGMGKALIDAGAYVVITGRREGMLKEACELCGNNMGYIASDITELTRLPKLVEDIEAKYGAIDILINNAGINLKKPALEVSDLEFQTIINTNVNGLFALTREVAKKMKERKKGSIIMITSMAAMYGLSYVSAYAASKSAVLGMSKVLANDLAAFGIRVNCIAPGFIDSSMLRKALDADPERKEKVLGRTPMKTFGLPEDIGFAAVYLSSDASKFVTGINLPVDGGNSIGF